MQDAIVKFLTEKFGLYRRPLDNELKGPGWNVYYSIGSSSFVLEATLDEETDLLLRLKFSFSSVLDYDEFKNSPLM